MIASPAFRAWFKGSKVVDSRGRPLVVYHATAADFGVFDTSRGDLGAHFGTQEQANKAVARTQRQPGDVPRIVPVFLSLRRPLRLKDTGSFHGWAIADQLVRKGIVTKDEAKRIEAEDWQAQKRNNALVRAAIEAAGYDGIVYRNETEGEGDSFIAFRPEQIKSAIGNRGTFDPKDPSILHGLGSESSKWPAELDRVEVFEHVSKYGGKRDRTALHLFPDVRYVLKEVPAASLRSDLTHDPARVAHPATAARLAKYAARSADTAPPVLLDFGGRVWDGHHRVYVAQQRGDATILAYQMTTKPPLRGFGYMRVPGWR